MSFVGRCSVDAKDDNVSDSGNSSNKSPPKIGSQSSDKRRPPYEDMNSPSSSICTGKYPKDSSNISSASTASSVVEERPLRLTISSLRGRRFSGCSKRSSEYSSVGGSVDIFDDDDISDRDIADDISDNLVHRYDVDDSSSSDTDDGGGDNQKNNSKKKKTAENKDYCNSTTSLVVSFSKLNENELTHLRKWNRRLNRTEVFEKYYFPAVWEMNEMQALAKYLKLVNPSAPASGSIVGSGGGRTGVSLERGRGRGRGLPQTGGSMRGGFTSGKTNPRMTNNAGRRNHGLLSKSLSHASVLAGGPNGGHPVLTANGFMDDQRIKHNPNRGTKIHDFTSSFTSPIKESSSNMAKFLLEKQRVLDPSKATKQAIDAIFFPYVHDPKSVLLKRGSVYLHGDSDHNSPSGILNPTGQNCHGPAFYSNERELMIFTYGFIVAQFALEDVFHLFLALSDREFLTATSFLDYLWMKFKDLDVFECGELDKRELCQIFIDMGVPMAESALNELIQRCDSDEQNKVNWQSLHEALRTSFHVPVIPTSSENVNFGKVMVVEAALKNDDGRIGSVGAKAKVGSAKLSRGSGNGSGSGDGLGKKIFGAFRGDSKRMTNIGSASLFTSVVRVDCLNIFCDKDSISKEMTDLHLTQTSFAVLTKERVDNPLIFKCSKPEHRDLWIDCFQPCVIRAWEGSKSPDVERLRSKLGWQHLIIRSTYSTLVVMNEVDALRRVLDQDAERYSVRKRRSEINALDEYNGYSALHYATILGYTQCMDALLRSGAIVKSGDRHGFSPMYHALSLRNDQAANVLEKYGADRSEDLKLVIQNEIKREEARQKEFANFTKVEDRKQAYMQTTSRTFSGFSDESNDGPSKNSIAEITSNCVRHK